MTVLVWFGLRVRARRLLPDPRRRQPGRRGRRSRSPTPPSVFPVAVIDFIDARRSAAMTDRRVDPTSAIASTQIAEGYEEQNRRTTFYLRLFVVLFGVAAVVFTFQQVKLGDQADKTRKLAEANQRLAVADPDRAGAQRARLLRGAERAPRQHDHGRSTSCSRRSPSTSSAQRTRTRDKVAALIKRAKAAKSNQDARQAEL